MSRNIDDIITAYGQDTGDISSSSKARAELAQLRASSAAWIDLWSYICALTNCPGYLPNEQNFDSMLDNAPRYVALREQVTEQARQLAEAREMIDQSLSDAVAIVNMSDGYINEMAEHLSNQLGTWLSANPAPQVDDQAAADQFNDWRKEHEEDLSRRIEAAS